MSEDEDGTSAADAAETGAKALEKAADALGENIGGLIDSDDPSDSTAADVERGFGVAGDVAGAAKEGAKAVGEAEDALSAAQSGDAAGAAGGVLGATGGAAGLASEGLGAIASATDDAGFREAARVAGIVQATAGLASRAVEQIGGLVNQLGGSSRHVDYELSIEDTEGWELQSFTATEALNEPYEMVLVVRIEDEDADPRALLGRNVEVLVDRQDHNRRHCGMIRRVEEGSHRADRVTATLTVVPALWSLSQGSDSFIFQEKTAKEILEDVLGTMLSPFDREADVSGLEREYPTREYCVQYRESPLAFAHRLMEEEGIGYYFDFDGDGWERCV